MALTSGSPARVVEKLLEVLGATTHTSAKVIMPEIADAALQELIDRAYAAAVKRQGQVLSEDLPLPQELIARPAALVERRESDRLAQRRQERNGAKPCNPRLVVSYQDAPVTAMALRSILEHYRYFLGEVKYFNIVSMVALGLPQVVWQNIFSRAKKRVELGLSIDNPAAYCLEAGRKECRYVKCKKGPLATPTIFKNATFRGTPPTSGSYRPLREPSSTTSIVD